MAKLTKAQAQSHSRALDLVHSDRQLSLDEREFILDNYYPAATHINTLNGAYFTPRSLAHDLSIYIPDGGTIIDLCAGIGHLSYYALLNYQSSSYYRRNNHVPIGAITCLEINPDYIAVGKRVVPEAFWIQADVFSPQIATLTAGGHPFDFAISNPPFGRVGRNHNLPHPVPVHGSPLELNVLAVAAKLARCGAFILPQASCPFKYSGQRNHEYRDSATFNRFRSRCRINLSCSSIDCSIYTADWRDVSPTVEIALYDLDEQIYNVEPDIILWRNRVTVNRVTYVFVDPAAAALFAQYARTSNALDTESLFRDGVPLPLEIITTSLEPTL